MPRVTLLRPVETTDKSCLVPFSTSECPCCWHLQFVCSFEHLLILRCPVISSVNFSSTAACMVESCGCSGTQRVYMVCSIASKNPSSLTHSSNCGVQFIVSDRFIQEPAFRCWVSQWLQVECIHWPVSWTKAIIQLEQSDKTPVWSLYRLA